MTLQPSHHVKIGGEEYIVKFGTSAVFDHSYQAPYIERTSVATSRSEGDYSQDTVFTQSSWRQGEGAKTMNKDNGQRYYLSENMDISGDSSGLQLLKEMTAITSTATSPDLGTGVALIRSNSVGISAAWPSNNDALNTPKYYGVYDGDWTEFSAGVYQRELTTTDHGDALKDMALNDFLFVGETHYFAFNGAIEIIDGMAIQHTLNNALDKFNFVCLGTDNTYLYAGRLVYDGVSGKYNTYIHRYPMNSTYGGAITTVSGYIEGKIESLAFHNGTMYALVVEEGPEKTKVYKYDSTITSTGMFVLLKNLPQGFIGQSIVSDGTVLYVGGKKKCAEGNYRGQVYHLTGASGSEILGNLFSYGDRDGVSNYECTSLAPNGNSVYFPWMYYGGMGRYDTINGGISRSYRQEDMQASYNYVDNIAFGVGVPYLSIRGSGAGDTKIYKEASTYPTEGIVKCGYSDLGLPVVKKLFTKIVVMSTTSLTTNFPNSYSHGSIGYSLNGDADNWVEGTPQSTEIDNGIYKYTLDLVSDNISAYNFSPVIRLFSNTANRTITPRITSVTTVAIPLLETPGYTEPRDVWKFSLVIAEQCRTLNQAIERGTAKLDNLRTLFKAELPVEFEAYDQPGVTHTVLIRNVSEISPFKARDNDYEATVNVECLKI